MLSDDVQVSFKFKKSHGPIAAIVRDIEDGDSWLTFFRDLGKELKEKFGRNLEEDVESVELILNGEDDEPFLKKCVTDSYPFVSEDLFDYLNLGTREKELVCVMMNDIGFVNLDEAIRKVPELNTVPDNRGEIEGYAMDLMEEVDNLNKISTFLQTCIDWDKVVKGLEQDDQILHVPEYGFWITNAHELY